MSLTKIQTTWIIRQNIKEPTLFFWILLQHTVKPSSSFTLFLCSFVLCFLIHCLYTKKPSFFQRFLSLVLSDLRCLEVEKEKQDPKSPRGALEACLTRSSISSSSSDDPPPNREASDNADADTDAQCKNHRASSNWGKFFKLWKRRSMKRLSSFPPLSGAATSISKSNKTHIDGMVLHDIYDFQSSLHNFSISDIEIATDNFSPGIKLLFF